MTPHSTNEDDHDGDKGKGQVSYEGDDSSAAMMYQLKEKEMMESLNTMKAELELKKLELRCQEQKYLDKEYECEKIKEIRDQMMEIKDRELQEAKTLAEDLQHRFNLLQKSMEDLHNTREEKVSDDVEIDPIPSDVPSFTLEERIDTQESGAGGSDVCPFCLRLTISDQSLPFHLNNCPDSLKWRGQDTNHSEHYQRIKCK